MNRLRKLVGWDFDRLVEVARQYRLIVWGISHELPGREPAYANSAPSLWASPDIGPAIFGRLSHRLNQHDEILTCVLKGNCGDWSHVLGLTTERDT